MSDNSKPGYALVDPRPIAAEAPYTFFLPTQEQLAALGEGDLVKLIFEQDLPGEEWVAERMWVRIITVREDDLTGVLESLPDELPLQAGDEVQFSRYHVTAIYWLDPASAPPTGGYRQYWEKCLVDACVLDGSEPVEYIYRETPSMGGEDDAFPDSGWRIRARRGNASDTEIEGREVQYVALGTVLNWDDSWLQLIDAPVGSAYKRNFATGGYEQLPFRR